MEWTDAGVGQEGRKTGRALTHPSAHTFAICSLKELKSRPGTSRTVLTSLPQTFYRHSNFLTPNPPSLILEPYRTLQLPLPPLRHDKQPHHQFFLVHGQTVDRDQLGLLQDFFSLSVPFHLGTLRTCGGTDVPLGSQRL